MTGGWLLEIDNTWDAQQVTIDEPNNSSMRITYHSPDSTSHAQRQYLRDLLNATTAAMFEAQVDAACVYVNAPTSFTDGAQFGLGAEIGISTQKLGPRGPMGLAEITTYKWLIEGRGQVRP